MRDFIRARFPQPFLRMSATQYRRFVLELSEHGMSGGAAYDALVAATAASVGAELISCERRAASVYESYGVKTRIFA